MNFILQGLCTEDSGGRNRTKILSLKKKMARLHATLNNRTKYLCPHSYRNANVLLEEPSFQLDQLGEAGSRHAHTNTPSGGKRPKNSLTILV